MAEEVTQALLRRMKRQELEWLDDESYDDWWQYQCDFAQAIVVIEDALASTEALRAEVQRLTYDGIHTCHDDCQRLPCVQRREIEALRAEIAQIEGVLREVGRKAWGNPDSRTCQEIEALVRSFLTARAALSEPTT